MSAREALERYMTFDYSIPVSSDIKKLIDDYANELADKIEADPKDQALWGAESFRAGKTYAADLIRPKGQE